MLRPGLLYFAYGCNMAPEVLAEIVGIGLPPGWVARLDDWRLAFNKGGEGALGEGVVANLVPEEGCRTYGVVYRLPHEALASLDAFERAPKHYRRETLWIEPVGRCARQAALGYVGQENWIVAAGRPDAGYFNSVIRGAVLNGLPVAYIEWLKALARGEPRDCHRSRA